MIKIWKYIVIPVAVFVAGLFIFSRILYQGVTDPTTDMPEATLPVVYMQKDGERINALHGYTEEMDAAFMRDTITPVGTDGTLSVSIDSYGYEIRSISFEVRSLDTTHLVQQSEAENLSVEEDVVTADLPIQNLLTEQTEYLLTLEVTGSGEPCYYYTRIIEEDTSDIGECISFVQNFHEITMQKTRQNELTDYMETKSGADNRTLQTVTLQNTLSQVCWGSMRGIEETTPLVSVREINDNGSVIILNYVLSATDEQEVTTYYSVEEYYRVRAGEERMYLLDFERTSEEIFRGDCGTLPSEDLVLGIRSADVDFMTNETGTIVCFVQAGELWSYNAGSGSLTQIFSFRSPDGFDVRENCDEHDIRILRVNENGNTDFAVYGYMNRGMHEGQVGISVCHFDNATNSVEEQAFLSSTESYQLLLAGIGQAMYITETGQFYFVMDDRGYSVDLATGQGTVEISDIIEGNYAGSQDGRYLAWTGGEDEAERKIMHLIDLESGRTDSIEAPEGFAIFPLGFLDSDCVYGLAKESVLGADDSLIPITTVVVVDFSDPDLAVLKTYESTDGYVSGVEVRDGNIYLEQMTLEDGEYVEAGENIIYNREMQEASPVSVVEIYSDIRETEVALRLPETIREEPERTESKWIRTGGTAQRLCEQIQEKTYYVYAKGEISLASDSLVEAVADAEANAGVVIGEDRAYVWNIAKPAAASVVYPTEEEEPVGQTLDLTGCTLDQVLYYVGSGLPVYAKQNGKSVVITGYDANSVTVYDPETEESAKETRSDTAEEFAASGNVFSVMLPE